MIGWKVVCKLNDGSLGSAVQLAGWSRLYAAGKRTTGLDGTPVLAFRTRAAARRFQPRLAHATFPLFKARLENPRPQPRIAPPWVEKGYSLFWEGTLPYPEDAESPDGTLACDAITLLEPAR